MTPNDCTMALQMESVETSYFSPGHAGFSAFVDAIIHPAIPEDCHAANLQDLDLKLFMLGANAFYMRAAQAPCRNPCTSYSAVLGGYAGKSQQSKVLAAISVQAFCPAVLGCHAHVWPQQ